jgi:hypothetical protein
MIHWFVTCAYTTTVRAGGDYVPRPASAAHAKKMGGTVTACGLQAGNWAKLFDLAFPVPTGENCAACATALTQVGRMRGRLVL